MVRTRHSLEALLMAKANRRRRLLPPRQPTGIEIALGLAAFVALLALLLFLAASIGG